MIYQYRHFTIKVDQTEKTFRLTFREDVLKLRHMPANVVRDANAAITDWRKRGYRQV